MKFKDATTGYAPSHEGVDVSLLGDGDLFASKVGGSKYKLRQIIRDDDRRLVIDPFEGMIVGEIIPDEEFAEYLDARLVRATIDWEVLT